MNINFNVCVTFLQNEDSIIINNSIPEINWEQVLDENFIKAMYINSGSM